jgi:hypothetical protein
MARVTSLSPNARSCHRSDPKIREVAIAVVAGKQTNQASIVRSELADFECGYPDRPDVHLDRLAFHDDRFSARGGLYFASGIN